MKASEVRHGRGPARVFRGIGLAHTLPLDDAVELLGDRGHDVRRLDRDGCVVEEVDQHRDAADAEHDTERDGEVGHELTALAPLTVRSTSTQ